MPPMYKQAFFSSTMRYELHLFTGTKAKSTYEKMVHLQCSLQINVFYSRINPHKKETPRSLRESLKNPISP